MATPQPRRTTQPPIPVTVREQQALGRHPETVQPGRGSHAEPFEHKERRGFALSVMDNPDQLMMYAQSTGESVPSQRLRFLHVLCGFDKIERDKMSAAQRAAGR